MYSYRFRHGGNFLLCRREQPAAVYGTGVHQFSLATGSPGELGLLKTLAEAFGKQDNAKMAWFKAGSGKSLQLLKDKKVDMIMVHAPAAEQQAVQEGWATQRTLLGSNEFFIVGPANDPAKIAEAKSAVEAYRRIAVAKAKFFSRGDNSGTHKKEMGIWKKAEIKPQGDWYVVTKDFMTATLKRANQEKGYFMVDSSTWVAAKKEVPNLKILFKGDQAPGEYLPCPVPAGRAPLRARPRPPNSSPSWPLPRGKRLSRITARTSMARGCITTRPTPRNMMSNLIHPDAVFMVHGFGHTLPVESRACGQGVSDSALMPGGLALWDQAGGAMALQEHFVTVTKIEETENIAGSAGPEA